MRERMDDHDIRPEAHRLVDSLPASAGWDDLMSEIYVRQAIEGGLADADAGRTVDHETAMSRIRVIAADHFTVSDLAQLDGQNGRHELLDGALIVSPLGTSRHQSLCLALGAALRDFVLRQQLGAVFAPGRVIVDRRTALEPDVLVVPGPRETASLPWESHAPPLLAVEVLSPSTRSFDHVQKRSAYLRRGSAEYWVVDADERVVTIFRPGQPDERAVGTLRWRPTDANEPLTIDLTALFEGVDATV